jgi:hypothetical protein
LRAFRCYPSRKSSTTLIARKKRCPWVKSEDFTEMSVTDMLYKTPQVTQPLRSRMLWKARTLAAKRGLPWYDTRPCQQTSIVDPHLDSARIVEN